MAPRRWSLVSVASIVLLVVATQLALLQLERAGIKAKTVQRSGSGTKRGATTPTVKKALDASEALDEEDDKGGSERASEVPGVLKSYDEKEAAADGSKSGLAGGDEEADEDDDTLVDPLGHERHAKESRAAKTSEEADEAPASTTKRPATSKKAAPSSKRKASGGSRSTDIIDLGDEVNEGGKTPTINIRIRPLSLAKDESEPGEPSKKPTLSPAMTKLVHEHKGKPGANGSVILTIKPSEYTSMAKLNATGEVVNVSKGSTTPSPTKKVSAKGSSTHKPAAKGSSTRKPTVKGGSTRKPTVKGSSTRKPAIKGSSTRKPARGGARTTRPPKGSNLFDDFDGPPPVTFFTRKPSKIVAASSFTSMIANSNSSNSSTSSTSSTSSNSSTSTSSSTSSNSGKKEPGPGGEMRPDNYKELMQSDKVLAVVVTNRGGFKGRRLNSKALAAIMSGKASVQQKARIAAQKPITVTTNNTYVLPAGHYYFPHPVRFAGLMSP